VRLSSGDRVAGVLGDDRHRLALHASRDTNEPRKS
jgi:hypothetical protein